MKKQKDNTNISENEFKLNEKTGYFQNMGVDVMAFDDIYPEGHQSGLSIIMHGNRVATNGDIRFEQTPGQWQPVPKQGKRELDAKANTITTSLSFPDTSRHLKGFNPMIYPDFQFDYKVLVKGEGKSIKVKVDLDQPIPDRFAGKICFNLELFPGSLLGKPWIMDNRQGIFPPQPNGPVQSMPSNYNNTGDFNEPDAMADINLLSGGNKGYNPIIADDIIAKPYAVGKRFTVRPDDPYNRFTIESMGTELKLYDGRMNHNNGWFVISSEVPSGKTKDAISWIITPNVEENWLYPPVVQTSQVGYHPNQSKIAVIELDKRESKLEKPILYKITEKGEEEVFITDGQEWGRFLRYNYLRFDFTDIKEEGLYKVKYGSSQSSIFRIARDVYDRGVWQPVLEYFLPVQMCHMRVNEKYRVWHSINQETRITEIHQPDGKNDILQQIEHGVLSVVDAYRSLGRLYRGIIENDLRQYVHLGDSASITDGIKGNSDDRWVFTEDNPPRELTTAAHLAAASRALKGFNHTLSNQALEAARELYNVTDGSGDARIAKIHAAVELLLATGEQKYKDFLLSETSFIVDNINQVGWFIGRAEKEIDDAEFTKSIRDALIPLKEHYEKLSTETPYGIPYRPQIWGAGWGIQRLGFQCYFLHKSYPDIFDTDIIFNGLNFVLGCHPGSNTVSFASGIGAKSATVGYGLNRADWSYIPGGVISGTALIRPDLPELLEFPYLWQQREYVLGGGSSHYMFLVLAVQELTKNI